MMTTIELPQAPFMQGLVQPPRKSPEGYYEYPYLYAYSPTGFWEGTGAGFTPPGTLSPQVVRTLIDQYGYNAWPFCNLIQTTAPGQITDSVRIDGNADFVLQGWAGAGELCEQFQLYGPGNQKLYSSNLFVSDALTGITGNAKQRVNIVNELVYPRGSSIKFDLITPRNLKTPVTLNSGDQTYTWTPNPGSLVFYGVKRFKGNLRYPEPSYYDYFHEPYSYRQVLPWSAGHRTSQSQGVPFTPSLPGFGNLIPLVPHTDPVTLLIDVRSYDFELHGITVRYPNMNATVTWPDPPFGPPVPVPNVNAESIFKMLLYDASNQRLANTPIDYYYWCNQMYWRTTPPSLLPNLSTECVNNFPTPPLMYPKGGQIRIEFYPQIISPLNAPPYEVEVIITGMNRVPC